jgi:osmoprotectant transport system substrate-binding protein
VVAVGTAALLGLAACSSSGDETSGEGSGEPLVIATTNFSETKILASMYQQVLAAKGLEVSIKELTTREVIAPALSSGEVQITPEYLGSFATYLNGKVNGPDAPAIASGNVDETFNAALPLAAGENITLLPPSAAQDQNAFAVTKDFATANKLTTLTQLGAYSQGSPITLGGPPECPQRPFCQPGLEETYDVAVAQFKALDAGGPLTISALTQGTIQVGLVFSSSGSVAANNLVVLDDDKDLQTAENILPAVYTPALTDEVSAALDSVSQVLTTDELQSLNQMVEVDRMDPEEVARQFLQDNDLL